MKRTISEKPTISILIAALNEEKIIEKTVNECFTLKDFTPQVFVVIDSKTVDHTKEVAQKAGARVLNAGNWKGKGAALKYAIPYCKGEYTIMIDADYQFLPRDIPKMISPLQHGSDVTLGTRYRKGAVVDSGSVTGFRAFGIHFLSLVTSIFCKQRITDILAGFKAFKTNVLKEIDMQENTYGYEAEVAIKAAQKGYKIKEVPIHYKKRVEGISKLTPIKHGSMFLWSIIKIGLHL